MRFRSFALLSLLSCVTWASACGELKRAPEGSPDGGEGDADASIDGKAPSDAGLADADGAAELPPEDFACDATNPWAAPQKNRPECATRQVKVLDTEIAIDATGVSIARTPAGRIGVSFNIELDGQSGEMHVVHFTPTSPSFTPTVLRHYKGGFDHAGHVSRIRASAPDTLHVLSHDVDDVTFSGEVVVLRSTGGGPLSAPELVVSGVKRPSELAFAIDAAGTSFASVRISSGVSDGGPVAKLAVRTRPAAGAWSPLPDLTTALTPGDAPGTGAAHLVTDAAGQLHVLYHHCEVFSHSTPRYHTLDGNTWSYRKTIDNAVPDGLSGYSAQLGVHGNRKWAAFFFRKAQQGSPVTADLRVATWESANETPNVSVLAQTIPSMNALYPKYRVAMAVDRFGMVHLAILTPSTVGEDTGTLTYMRQARSSTGTTVWLSDVIDNDAISAAAEAFVDIVVDEQIRPHIAYISGKDLKVRYATRYDR